jgi:SAM-dependent methyltransferase
MYSENLNQRLASSIMTEMDLHCSACDSAVGAFLPGPNGRPSARCPFCQSLERHRFLAILIDSHAAQISSSAAVLEFAPTGSIRKMVGSLQPARYISVDINRHFGPSVLGDITALPFPDGSIDVLICYHVLEHVGDDNAAIRELARVMNPLSIALIQVPRNREAPTAEDLEASAEERTARFGQADHVRYYGTDLERRLYENGLVPGVITPHRILSDDHIRRYALMEDEEVWLCRSRSGSSRFFGETRNLQKANAELRAELVRFRSHPLIRLGLSMTRPFRRVLRLVRSG